MAAAFYLFKMHQSGTYPTWWDAIASKNSFYAMFLTIIKIWIIFRIPNNTTISKYEPNAILGECWNTHITQNCKRVFCQLAAHALCFTSNGWFLFRDNLYFKLIPTGVNQLLSGIMINRIRNKCCSHSILTLKSEKKNIFWQEM